MFWSFVDLLFDEEEINHTEYPDGEDLDLDLDRGLDLNHGLGSWTGFDETQVTYVN